MSKKPKRKKLTREQKKIVWSKPTSNAGVGWTSPYYSHNPDPHKYEEGVPIPQPRKKEL